MQTVQSELINRVAESELKTIALDQYIDIHSIVEFDLQKYLFQGLILKEKDFREVLKTIDWAGFTNKDLAVFCSADAIIPMWAYMLVSSHATPFVTSVHFGTKEQVFEKLLVQYLESNDWSAYKDKKVVIKGCSDQELPASAYLTISKKLQPLVQSMMYGEPCSTVPIFKRPRAI